MEDQKKQLIAKLKESQNVLVTVSKNPSVDQLAAAIGFTLALNKLDKHATAVYSGETPSTLEFLKPEDTLETNTDSLRDFIIALDKSKADKLRYKVEDQVVRIFITPYKTSISDKDLDFSQGDFNVDVVVALGVTQQQDIDDAIQAHGRILHDAVVSSISVQGQPELGTLNVVDTEASSLSEVVSDLVQKLDGKVIDGQIATALLTGIVAMTERFSNEHTTPETMKVSAALMSAGANQQLIISELETPLSQPNVEDVEESDDESDEQPKDPGTLEISHDEDSPQVEVDEDGQLIINDEMLPKIDEVHTESQDIDEADRQEPLVTRERMVEPPSRTGALTANTEEEGLDKPTEDLAQPSAELPFLSHEQEPDLPVDEPVIEEPAAPAFEVPAAPPQDFTPPAPQPAADVPAPVNPAPAQFADMPPAPVSDEQTLADIEKAVHSPHAAPAEGTVDDARSAVEAALSGMPQTNPDPIAALNAQPLGPQLHEEEAPQMQPAPGFGQPQEEAPGTDMTMDMPLPGQTPTAAPVSAFPGGSPQPQAQQDNTLPPPPPVPPPPIIPS